MERISKLRESQSKDIEHINKQIHEYESAGQTTACHGPACNRAGQPLLWPGLIQEQGGPVPLQGCQTEMRTMTGAHNTQWHSECLSRLSDTALRSGPDGVREYTEVDVGRHSKNSSGQVRTLKKQLRTMVQPCADQTVSVVMFGAGRAKQASLRCTGSYQWRRSWTQRSWRDTNW